MNDLEYLNQISYHPPEKPESFLSSFFSSTFFKILAAVIGLVLLSVVGLAVVTSMTPAEVALDSELSRLYLHASDLNALLSSYSPRVKSSALRASSSSLEVVLAELETNVSSTLSSVYGLPAPSSEVLPAEESALFSSSEETLTHALQNGILDRYFAPEVSYRLENLLIVENLVLSQSSSPEISDYLESSISSLTQLKETFDSYSSSK
ncbi:hypothetical protein IKG02_01100 [Candidatus Saccharibacteria bacterium]|nr:hypothetical protein [Candidatus Saccharibacteria bacterium]